MKLSDSEKRDICKLIEQGQIIEKTQSTDNLIQEKLITKHWHDWIDYWSVDFDYE